MSTFQGHLEEFPGLAIDYFRPRQNKVPIYAYLLSHTHSDHLQGLENKAFGGAFIYCSRATKTMLLLTQDVQSRTKLARGEIGSAVYKYRHLATGRHDLLRVLEYHVPTRIQVGSETLQVTMIDANHCPGASMFLIESRDKAVLYTGDMRAESSFLERFVKNPLMAAYTSGRRRLDCIYLDTSARINGHAYPSKSSACQYLIDAIAQYPLNTIFYLNARCTGYEELWIAIHCAFNTQIHVDHYRKDLYAAASRDWEYGRVLDTALTCDSSSTRFHSCESIDPCQHRPHESQEVYIKIVNHLESNTTRHLAETRGVQDLPLLQKSPTRDAGECSNDGLYRYQTEKKDLPRVLLVPFARHSSFPELVEFVSTLRPRAVHSCTGNVGHLFKPYCWQECDSQARIKHHQELVISGLWHESSRCRRQGLMQDIML